MPEITVELSWKPPTNADELDDINRAIGAFAETAQVSLKDIELGTATYDDDYAAASYTFDAKAAS